MYCPQCATENADNASFCRGCGSNIRFVSQALAGQVTALEENEPEEDSSRARRRRHGRGKGAPSVERAVKNVFMGLAFVLVALGVKAYAPGGTGWWFWMLIPAFGMLGGGFAEMARLKFEKDSRLPATPRQTSALPPSTAQAPPSVLPAPNTVELIPQPPSVTEGTTRHLKTSVESRPKE